MKRVHIVMPWFGTFAGGAMVALTSIARILQQAGFDVEVLTSCSRSPYEDWQASQHPAGSGVVDGLRVLRFPVNASDNAGYHRAVSLRTRRPVIRDARAEVMATPAEGPSFGMAPAGTWTWTP